MNPILFYDTETTGLPNWSMPSGDPSQPHITQLAAELCDEETGETIMEMNMLVKPDGWEIPLELQEVTGITMERAMAEGAPIAEVLDHFMAMWEACDLRCAHNESFDMRMIRIALKRSELYSKMMRHEEGKPDVEFADYWKKAPAFCTQSSSIKIINLPPTEKMVAAKRKGPKPPNLGEAYKFFTGEDLVGAHDAKVDIMACKKVYFGIKKHLALAA